MPVGRAKCLSFGPKTPTDPQKGPQNIGIFVITYRNEGFACYRKVGAQVTTFCSKFMWAEQNVFSFVRKPPQTPQKAPQILEIPFFDTFAQIGSVRND